MFTSPWFAWALRRQNKGRSRPSHSSGLCRRGIRLALEQLEDRTVPANFTAATTNQLVDAIIASNRNNEPDIITLAPGKTFTLTDGTFSPDGPRQGLAGLPAITADNNLTIQGNGDTIVRSATAPAFRLFDVAMFATLTLENVTLKGGLDNPTGSGAVTGSEAKGGAIYNEGSLTLRAVTVTGNSAVGWGYGGDDYGVVGTDGFGGGIYSRGVSLTLEAGTVITNNSAVGASVANQPRGRSRGVLYGGGSGYGGGVYVAGGIATFTGVTLSNNTARGGDGADGGGWGFGGALCVNANFTLSNCILFSNSAVGGKGGGGNDGWGLGGALFLGGGTVTMTGDAFSSNTAVGAGARGGAIFVNYGTVTLRQCTISGNSAQSRKKASTAVAEGGGLFIDSVYGAKIYLDAFTLSHTTGNAPDDINGPYILIT